MRRPLHRLLTWLSGPSLRHLARQPLHDLIARHGPPAVADRHPCADLMRAVARADADDALARLGSHRDGLSRREAAARLARNGPNEIAQAGRRSFVRHLWECYANPFNLLLTTLAALSWTSGDPGATLVVASMVLLSTLIRLVQERRSDHAAERLRALVANRVTVLRHARAPRADGVAPSQPMDIPLAAVVPGDIVRLSAGDMVPADCRVLASRDLYVAQSAMTGEALPAEKRADAGSVADDTPPTDLPNLLFMGTSVASGTATALVVVTGRRTYFGALAARIDPAAQPPNAFQAGVNRVSLLLVRFALVMAPVVLLVNGFGKHDWLSAFLFALSIAVGLTPEMLPMIVTTTMAKGAVALSRRKVIVKRLDAIQSLGAMDVLCTDKTGTLTEDRITLSAAVDAQGRASDDVARLGFLNAWFQQGLKSVIDQAVIAAVPDAQAASLRGRQKLDEVPFDFERRRLSVLVDDPAGAPLLVCKGALEETLACCSRVADGATGGDARPLDDTARRTATEVAAALNAQGMRVVAVATRTLPADRRTCSLADEADLVLAGFLAFLDPPRDSAPQALRALAAHGIAVKVLTGDNAAVARRICDQVGLPVGEPVDGAALDRLDDAALAQVVEHHTVFVKLAPLQKARIVSALRAGGHAVGYLGDGVNDAPALRAADVGVSVDSAVDIAKEAADIILLEKSLVVIDDGVVEGRTTFCNMQKYIRLAASSNFGNVLSVLAASALLPFLPMRPLQLLLQNLLYDVAQTGIPFDRVDDAQLATPIRWNTESLGRFMLFFGPISSAFDLLTFAVLWWGFGADSPASQGLFQSGWFVVGLVTQTLIVHAIRSPRSPLTASRPAAPLVASTLAIAAVALYLPASPLGPRFGLQPLPPAYYGFVATIVVGYLVVASLLKRLYVRRHGWQ